ncbi:MAG: glycosyltransferase [Candidatus Binatia bacterium]
MIEGSNQTRRLNILHVATINKPITSQIGYGPIETVIYNIDKGLHALGHRSIVACSSDSTVTGEKYETVSRSHGDYWRGCTPEGQTQVDLHLSQALARARLGDIDIIHMHEWFERVYTGSFNPSVPIVMTLHVPGQHSGIMEFRERRPDTSSRPLLHFVAISEYQRRQYTNLIPVAKTVPHGIDVEDYLFTEESNRGNYLFSIGRITEVKGQDIAIAVAKQAGAKLVLAGCVQNKKEDQAFFTRLKQSIDLSVDVSRQPVDKDYYDKVMKPLLSSDKQIIYIGELDTAAKKHWYRHAQATLFPIRWGEPFGMVLIESMASGAPVLAFGEGAVPEIVRHGETGFVVDSVESMVKAVGRIEHLDRRNCWKHVKTNFSIQKMAEGYAALYEQLAAVPAFSPVQVGQRLALQRSQYISGT